MRAYIHPQAFFRAYFIFAQSYAPSTHRRPAARQVQCRDPSKRADLFDDVTVPRFASLATLPCGRPIDAWELQRASERYFRNITNTVVIRRMTSAETV